MILFDLFFFLFPFNYLFFLSRGITGNTNVEDIRERERERDEQKNYNTKIKGEGDMKKRGNWVNPKKKCTRNI